jgi:hypothetical protein
MIHLICSVERDEDARMKEVKIEPLKTGERVQAVAMILEGGDKLQMWLA